MNYIEEVNLNEIEITEDEFKYIKECVDNSLTDSYKKNKIKYEAKLNFYIDVYKLRFKLNCSVHEIGTILGKSQRNMQLYLKYVGWNYDRFEAQQLAVAKGRDYKKIRLKAKETLSNNILKGSEDEEYIRHKLNLKLPYYLLNSQVIIGLNNMSILNNGKEVDIPIIIIKNNIIYKFAIEVNGDYWHQDEEKDKIKLNKLNEIDYKLFYVWVGGNTKTQREIYGIIDKQIEDICNDINEIVNRG